MEKLFVNCYEKDRAVMKEFYRYFFFLRPLNVVAYVLLGIAFVFALVLLILGIGVQVAVFTLGFVPFWVGLRVVSYVSTVNAAVKRNQELFGETVNAELYVTEEGIEDMAPTGALTKMDYSVFKQAYRTKNLLLLRTKTKLVMIFRRDSFTVGTEADFVQFLQGKGIQIK